jgi:hypothetical protein
MRLSQEAGNFIVFAPRQLSIRQNSTQNKSKAKLNRWGLSKRSANFAVTIFKVNDTKTKLN